MLTAFLWDDSKPAGAYIIAGICALLMIQILYPPSFLMGQGDFFYRGDAAQHVSGWLFFAQDRWHFPLLFTDHLNYPEGISIAFTDSIPLAALLFKIFHSFLPINFNYIGLWHAFAYTTQAISATFFIRALGRKSLFSALIASLFALAWPTLTWRIGHTSLITHSLIIFSLAYYFLARTQQILPSTAFNFLIGLIFIALLVHPYLFALCFSILCAFLGEQYFSGQPIFLQIKRLCLSLILILFAFFIFGYIGNSISADGFDFFSMNLAAPFCGGQFIHCSFDATGGQYEGFQYFGLGFLLLLSTFFYLTLNPLSHLSTPPWHQIYIDHRTLLLVFCCLFIFALSNKIYVGNFKLLHYPITEKIDEIANIFRSSGRFFWPISYTILFSTLAFFLQIKQLKFVLLLIIAFGIQWVDTSLLRKNVIDTTHKLNQPTKHSKQLENIFSTANTLYMYPIYGCHDNKSIDYLDIQMMAALSGAKFNTGYLARQKINCDEKNAFFYHSPQPNSLYITPVSFISKTFTIPPIFTNTSSESQCILVYSFVVCGSLATISNIDNIQVIKNKKFPSWQPSPTLLFDTASLLHSDISTVSSNIISIIDVKSEGFLSYGPYIELVPGIYTISVQYMSKSSLQSPVGFWDIFSSESWGKPLKSFTLLGTEGQIKKVSYKINITEAVKKLEVRTYYSGFKGLSIYHTSITKND